MGHGMVLVLGVTLALTAASYAGLDVILCFFAGPIVTAGGDAGGYLLVVFAGLLATAVYNFLACLLRALGNSAAPLWFLGTAAVGNVMLDLLFVLSSFPGASSGRLWRRSLPVSGGYRLDVVYPCAIAAGRCPAACAMTAE